MFRVMLCYLEISFSIQKQTVYTNTNRVQLTYWFLILNLAGIIFFFKPPVIMDGNQTPTLVKYWEPRC